MQTRCFISPLITLMTCLPERSDSEVKDLMEHSQTEISVIAGLTPFMYYCHDLRRVRLPLSSMLAELLILASWHNRSFPENQLKQPVHYQQPRHHVLMEAMTHHQDDIPV